MELAERARQDPCDFGTQKALSEYGNNNFMIASGIDRELNKYTT